MSEQQPETTELDKTPEKTLRLRLCSLVVNLFLLSTVSILCLGVIEASLRHGLITNIQYTRVSAGTYKSSTAETNRVLFIGDSFLRSDGPLSRHIMAGLSLEGVSSFNAAISGNGPYQYLTALETYLGEFKPSIVVLGYYVGNDITNTIIQQNKREGKLIEQLKNLFRVQVRKLYLYHAINQVRMERATAKVTTKMPKNQPTQSSPQTQSQQTAINPFLAHGASRSPGFLLDNLLIDSDVSKKAWNKASELLLEMHNKIVNSGARFAIIIFPSDAQLSEQRLNFYRSLGYTTNDKIVGSTIPQDKLLNLCKTLEISCLDLYPPIAKETERGRDLFLKNDPHFSNAGDAFVSKQILRFIRNKLLP